MTGARSSRGRMLRAGGGEGNHHIGRRYTSRVYSGACGPRQAGDISEEALEEDSDWAISL